MANHEYNQEQVTQWLKRTLGADQVSIENWAEYNDTGYSGITIIFDANYTLNGAAHARKLVLKGAPPEERRMWPEYDMRRQVQCLQFTKRVSELPIPEVIGANLDEFPNYFVMEFVSGEVPPDGATAPDAYLNRGCLFEAGTEGRRQFDEDFVTRLAQLHNLTVEPDLVNLLERKEPGKNTIAKEVEWLNGVYHWAKRGVALPSDHQMEWLRNNVPDIEANSLVWGDARYANVLVKDSKIAAMLDWELALIGPGELDLIWLLEAHQHRLGQEGANQLDGFLSPDEIIALYEQKTGRPVRSLDYFRAYTLMYFQVISLCMFKANGAAPDSVPLDSMSTYHRLEKLITAS